MKILQINAVYQNGSTGRNIYEMHNQMISQGIDSYIACADQKNNIQNYFQIGNPLDWKIHAFLSRLTGLQGYFSTSQTKKLINYLNKIKPDIVHLHNVHANYINLPLLFKHLSTNNIATVINLHDCWFYTGKCTHYTKIKCTKWKTQCNHCPKLKNDNKSWFFDRTNKMLIDKKNWYESIKNLSVIGVSNWILNESMESILKNAKFHKCIYNWIDLDIFHPTSLTKDNIDDKFKNKFIILGVANGWSESKGINEFLELSKQLKDDEMIVLVGNATSIDLPSNIINIPPTKSVEELVKYYNLADVFLQLSLEESFGKVVAESLACGTPVITVDSTANKELVSTDCGFVSDSLDSVKIYSYVSKIKNNTKSFYTKKCRSYAMTHFDSTTNINNYINFYKQILENKEI